MMIPNRSFTLLSAWVLMSYVQAIGAESVTVVSNDIVQGAKQPRVAVDAIGTVYVVFGAGQEIYVCKSVDSAKTYGKPVRVAQVPKLALGMRRGPRIVAGNGWIVVTAISHQTGELLSWRSADKGDSWSGPTSINDAAASASEGLHGMAVGADGTIAVVWLDHRHQGAQIFGSVSDDSGLTWKPNHQIYASPSGTVCECCHPSVVIGPTHEIFVMWRNLVDGNRDMYVTRSMDRGQSYEEASKLGTGTWPLNACPMDGGDFAVAHDGALTTVWRRDKALYMTRGARVNEMSLGTGEQACVTLGEKVGYLAWVQRRGGALMVSKLGSNEPKLLAEKAADPSISILNESGNSSIVVWETGMKSGPSISSATVSED